ncbi:MAG: hypothetical protein ABI583_15070 [Betaproteobacteria bacterium]
MNYATIKCAGIAVAIAAAVATTGCTEKSTALPNAGAVPGSAATTDPRAQVLGVAPGGAAKETPETTSTAKSDVSKAQQATAMPMPGQANDHSTLSPKASQKPVPATR